MILPLILAIAQAGRLEHEAILHDDPSREDEHADDRQRDRDATGQAPEPHDQSAERALTGRGPAVRWVRLPEVRSAGGSVVGLGRFELPASSSRTKRAAKLRHSP